MAKTRFAELDIFRGWAIVLMIFYHTAYDLSYFKLIDTNLEQETFWIYMRYVIVTMFLVSVGISLVLAHRPKIHWDKMMKRTFILGAASLLVSLATYIQFPNSWVYFGILHFILFASWAALPFLLHPRVAILAIVIILTGAATGWLHMHGLFSLLQKPFHLPLHRTEDVVRFIPWFGAVLSGVVIAYYHYHTRILKNRIFSAKNRFNDIIAFMGRHALLIYLLHLPLIFGIIDLYTILIQS